MGQSIPEWTKQNLSKTTFTKIEGCGLLSRLSPFKFFKGCLPQVLLGPFLNILSQRQLYLKNIKVGYKETEAQLQKIFWELPKEQNIFRKTPLTESAFTKVSGYVQAGSPKSTTVLQVVI